MALTEEAFDTSSVATVPNDLAGELPVRTKFSWGFAGLGAEALRQSRNAWLIYFYTSTAVAGSHTRLSLALVSVLLFSGKLIEAFVDPLVGHWSDRTSSRWGRRIPFILVSTPPTGILAVLIFMPPSGAGMLRTAIYFFVMLELFFLVSSLAVVPFEALMPEIARTSQQRISLSAWRVLFGVGGAALGLIGSGLLVSGFGYRTMAIAVASFALISRVVGLFGIWPRIDRSEPTTTVSLKATLKQTVSNRAFLKFMLSFVLFMTGLTMVIGLLPFYVTAILRKSNTGLWSSLLTSLAIGTMALAIPFFARLGRRTSNIRAYRKAMVATACVFPVLCLTGLIPVVPREAQALIAMVVIGAPLAGVYLFPGPIVAEFCDTDARNSGIRREGMFFSAQVFMDKLIEAFGPLILGLVLILGDQPERNLGVRMVGPVAGLVVFAGYLLVRRDFFGSNEAEPNITAN